MRSNFKVACVQNSSGEDILQNIIDVEELVIQAHEKHADLICLPEYFCYLDNDDERMLAHSYFEEEHPALSHFRKVAKFKCLVTIGFITYQDQQ